MGRVGGGVAHVQASLVARRQLLTIPIILLMIDRTLPHADTMECAQSIINNMIGVVRGHLLPTKDDWGNDVNNFKADKILRCQLAIKICFSN